MKVVVDTDILSEIQRGKNAQVLARAAAHERAHGGLSRSVLSVFEVVQGWQQRGRADRAAAFLAWIEPLEIVPFDLGSARLAGVQVQAPSTPSAHDGLEAQPSDLGERSGRNFQPEAPNQSWAGDVTYIYTSEGWAYLAVLLDLFSRLSLVPLAAAP